MYQITIQKNKKQEKRIVPADVDVLDAIDKLRKEGCTVVYLSYGRIDKTPIRRSIRKHSFASSRKSKD